MYRSLQRVPWYNAFRQLGAADTPIPPSIYRHSSVQVNTLSQASPAADEGVRWRRCWRRCWRQTTSPHILSQLGYEYILTCYSQTWPFGLSVADANNGRYVGAFPAPATPFPSTNMFNPGCWAHFKFHGRVDGRKPLAIGYIVGASTLQTLKHLDSPLVLYSDTTSRITVYHSATYIGEQ